MKVEISVPEVVSIFKEIQEQPEKLFEMIRFDIRETVGEYLTAISLLVRLNQLGKVRLFVSRNERREYVFLVTDHLALPMV